MNTHGMPEAGPVSTYRIVDGAKVLVSVTPAREGGISSGSTLPGGPNQPWVGGAADGRVHELGTNDEDATDWTSDRSDG